VGWIGPDSVAGLLGSTNLDGGL